MEENEIKKILKNLDTENKTKASDSKVKEDNKLDVESFQKKYDDLLIKYQALQEESKYEKKVNHLLSKQVNHLSLKLDLKNIYFSCELGDGDIPNTIYDMNDDALIIIPNNSSCNSLLCLHLCSYLNKVFSMDTSFESTVFEYDSIYEILEEFC